MHFSADLECKLNSTRRTSGPNDVIGSPTSHSRLRDAYESGYYIVDYTKKNFRPNYHQRDVSAFNRKRDP